MGNNIEDSMDTRWKVLRSMLDEFPQLQNRMVQYLLENRSQPKNILNHQEVPEIRELIRKALNEHQLERLTR